MDAADVGRRLAGRHHDVAVDGDFDPSKSLLNYAEVTHHGDWSLRSALVRVAQPDPEAVGALLEQVRRLDAPLHHVARTLAAHVVVCDRGLTSAAVVAEDGPRAAYLDVRVADIGRLSADGLAEDRLVAGYEEHSGLNDHERLAVPLLAAAARIEKLAVRLSAWADAGPDDPPLTAVADGTDVLKTDLDRLGVPVESGPPPRGARSR